MGETEGEETTKDSERALAETGVGADEEEVGGGGATDIVEVLPAAVELEVSV